MKKSALVFDLCYFKDAYVIFYESKKYFTPFEYLWNGLEEWKELLTKLCSVFCVNYVHNVPPERGYSDYEVSIHYNKKISCTSDELISQFNNLWPIINRSWLEFWDKDNNNFSFWQMTVSQYTISHPYLCEMIKILLASASTTRPLERLCSKLGKICYKDRNKVLVKNLETLYLLSLQKSCEFNYDETVVQIEN